MRQNWTDYEEAYLANWYNIKNDSDIAKIFGRSRSSVCKKRIRLNLLKYNRYVVNENFFKLWSSDMAYILGYWFADGCMRKAKCGAYRIEFTSNDKELLNKVKYAMNTNVNVYEREYKNKNQNHSFRLRISNKTMYNDILNIGGTPRKSLTAKFPNIPKVYVFDFIRGYFDGDGSITLRNKEPSISFVGTKNFLNGIEENLPYKGSMTRISKKTWGLRYNVEYALEILDCIYKNKEGIKLERKYKRYLKGKMWKRQRKLRCDSQLLKMNGYPKSYNGVVA